jgi:hypothetical protein
LEKEVLGEEWFLDLMKSSLGEIPKRMLNFKENAIFYSATQEKSLSSIDGLPSNLRNGNK